MGLKRKRSFTTLSSPSATSDSSHLSISPNGPQYFYQSMSTDGSHSVNADAFLGYSPPEPYMADGLLIDSQLNGGSKYVDDSTPSHLNSRTRKRFRDNRPDEASIHSHTLQLLFSAQQRHHDHDIDVPIAIDGFEPFKSPPTQPVIPDTIDCDHGMLTPSPTPAHSRLPSEPCLPPLSNSDQRRTSSASLPLCSNMTREPGQTSLHSFFPSDPSASITKRPSSAHVKSTTTEATPFSHAAPFGSGGASGGAGGEDAMDLELPSSSSSSSFIPQTHLNLPLHHNSNQNNRSAPISRPPTATPTPTATPSLTPLSTSFSALHNRNNANVMNNNTNPFPPGHGYGYAPEVSTVEIVSMDVDVDVDMHIPQLQPLPPSDMDPIGDGNGGGGGGGGCLHLPHGHGHGFGQGERGPNPMGMGMGMVVKEEEQ